MDFRLRILFDRRKKASDTTKGIVEIEITRRGASYMRKRISTGVSLYGYQWKDSSVVNHADSIALNLEIQRKYRELVEYFSSVPSQLNEQTCRGLT